MFNNCGRVGFDADRWSAWDYGSNATAACDADLKVTYATTYYPYLSGRCFNCHSTAHGSTDLNISFNAFKSKTAATIDIKAADGHNGLLGSEQTAAINAFKPQWNTANDRYMACVASAPSAGGGPNIRTIPKAIPNIEDTRANRNNWKTVTWDIESEVTSGDAGRFKLSYKIETRYAMTGNTVIGLEFRNPAMRLKVAGSPILVAGLEVYLDGAMAADVTSYSTLNATISTTTDVALAPGAAVAFAYNTATTSTTQIAFQLRNIRIDGGPGSTGGATGGATGSTSGGLPATMSFTELTSTNANLNVFRASCFSCHSSGSPAGGLDMTNYTQARAAATDIRNRMNNAGNPMPPSGILPANRRDLVDVWVSTGAPQ